MRRRRPLRSAGQAIVEAALVLPLFLLLLLGAIQFALAWHTRDVALSAAQEAARTLAALGPDQAGATAAAEARARQVMRAGMPSTYADRWQVTAAQLTAETARVTLSGPIPLAPPLGVLLLLPGLGQGRIADSVPYSVTAVMRREQFRPGP